MPDTSSSPSSELNFEKDDAFGWSGFASKLEAFLLTETEFVEGSLVTSLNAPFGSGKTTFLRMWKSQLDTRRASGAEAPMCVVINAWEDDYCGDPLFSLVDAIEKEMGARVANEHTKKQIASLKEATKDISWFMLGMAGDFVSHWTGFDPAAAGELAEKKKRANRGADHSNADLFTMFKRRKEALQRLKKALRSLFAGEMHPVFVIVDELDRCRPDFAIQYLRPSSTSSISKGLSSY
jgi:predicted KAP-like P-loop ATPase